MWSFRRPVILVMLVLAGACATGAGRQSVTARADAASSAGAQVAGEWIVETVNGRPLPYRLREYEGGWTELASGSLTLRDDGTFTETGAVRLVAGGTSNTNTHNALGRYAVDGVNLRFTFERGGRTETAVLEAGKLTMRKSPEVVVTYRRG